MRPMILLIVLGVLALVVVLAASSTLRGASKGIDAVTKAATPERVDAAARRVDGWTAKLKDIGNRKL